MYSNRHGLNVLLHACHLFHDACWFNTISVVSNSVCNPDIGYPITLKLSLTIIILYVVVV